MENKFSQDQHEIFGYTYHKPQFSSEYVRENGVYVFSTQKDGIKVQVSLSTGNSFKMGDYNFPSPDYEVESILYNDEIVSLDHVENDDPELYEAICDLTTQCAYSQDVEDYTFNCEGCNEDNFGHEITVEHSDLDLRNYSVISCNLK